MDSWQRMLEDEREELRFFLREEFKEKESMDQEEREMVKRWIEEAIKPLVERIEALERDMDNHEHDEYASIDHVERSEESVKSQIYRLRNDLDNLEYRVNDVDRKAERAQSAADNASRNSRGW